MIRFNDPLYFLVVPVVILLIWQRVRQKRSTVRYPALSLFASIKPPPHGGWMKLLPVLRLLAFSFLVIALARPQRISGEREVETEGIDIVISLDISGSMMAEDFKPQNRLNVAIQEAKKFVQGRMHDRIGLVVFASQSYTQCPLTNDYGVLMRLMDEVQIGLIKDGTAIGLGIANAVNRLRSSDAKSKVIILITDGENNSGNIDPITAAELARSFHIKIHTIGIGRGGLVPFPVDDPLFGRRYVQARVDIDEGTLQQIAHIAGGLFFRAYDEGSLESIYKEIDQMERSQIKVRQYTTFEELFPWFLYPTLALLVFEMVLARTVLMKIP